MTTVSLTILLANAMGQTGGRDVYIAKCSSCHAPDGSGNSTVGRSLKLNDIRPTIQSMTDEQLRQVILEGKGKMPPNKKLDDEKIRNLTMFLRDLVAGNPETGRAVAEAQAQPLAHVDEIFRDKCSACHGLDGAGQTTIGKSLQIPDLKAAAVQNKNAEELAEIIGRGKGRMPGYAKKFNPVQIRQLAAYIQAFKKTEDQKATSAASPETAPHAPSSSMPVAPQPVSISTTPGPAARIASSNSPKTEKNEAVAEPEPKPKLASTPTGKKPPPTGRQMYIAKCSACHCSDGSGSGTIGKSMKIPSLISREFQAKSDEALVEVIKNGVGRMPAYKKKYSAEQIRLLIAYVRELAKTH